MKINDHVVTGIYAGPHGQGHRITFHLDYGGELVFIGTAEDCLRQVNVLESDQDASDNAANGPADGWTVEGATWQLDHGRDGARTDSAFRYLEDSATARGDDIGRRLLAVVLNLRSGISRGIFTPGE